VTAGTGGALSGSAPRTRWEVSNSAIDKLEIPTPRMRLWPYTGLMDAASGPPGRAVVWDGEAA